MIQPWNSKLKNLLVKFLNEDVISALQEQG